MSVTIQLRGDTAASWTSVNPTLAAREIGLETDTGLYKIGNGSTAWTSLSYTALAPTFTTAVLDAQSSDPSAAAAGTLTVYSKAICGRIMLKHNGPSNEFTALQPFLARNKVGYWCPQGNSTGLPGVLGYTAPTFVGTLTARNIATTSLFTRMRRLGCASATTAGSLSSARVAVSQITMGDGAGNGGFHKIIRFGCSDNATVAGARQFVGIAASISAPTNVEPSTLTNVVGIGHGAADTNMNMYCAGTTTQPGATVNLGASFPINTLSADAYELALFSPTNVQGTVSYEVTNLSTGAVAIGSFGDSSGVAVPASSQLLTYLWAYRSNNATALAVGLDWMSDYIETDN